MHIAFPARSAAYQHLIIPYAASRSPTGQSALQGLKLFHLEQLLSTLTRVHVEQDDLDTPSPDMPHERIRAHVLNLPANHGDWPWAALEQGTPSPQPQAYMTPCHWQIGMDQVVMLNPEHLQLTEAESQALLAAMQPFLTEDGLTVRYVHPTQWHVQGDMLQGVAGCSLDRVIGMNVNAWLPKGEAAQSVRRLQSEMQMLLYNHPVNDARLAQRRLTVNAFWLHGVGILNQAPASPAPQMTLALRSAALREDAQAWRQAWQDLDTQLLAPLAHARSRTPVTLTLCSEHAAHTYQSHTPSVWQRAQRLFRPLTVQSVLQAL